MEQYIPKAAVVVEIEKLFERAGNSLGEYRNGAEHTLISIKDFLDTLEIKEVNLEKEIKSWLDHGNITDTRYDDYDDGDIERTAKHFFELGLKAQHDNWKVVDNTNLPQADKNKIYCVFTKQRYILAKVINHPQDGELLQWKCTEFPNHRYDMCEGDKYMQIV